MLSECICSKSAAVCGYVSTFSVFFISGFFVCFFFFFWSFFAYSLLLFFFFSFLYMIMYCIKNGLPDRHLCLKLYPGIISLSLSLSLRLKIKEIYQAFSPDTVNMHSNPRNSGTKTAIAIPPNYICLSVAVYLCLCLCLSVSLSLSLFLSFSLLFPSLLLLLSLRFHFFNFPSFHPSLPLTLFLTPSSCPSFFLPSTYSLLSSLCFFFVSVLLPGPRSRSLGTCENCFNSNDFVVVVVVKPGVNCCSCLLTEFFFFFFFSSYEI